MANLKISDPEIMSYVLRSLPSSSTTADVINATNLTKEVLIKMHNDGYVVLMEVLKPEPITHSSTQTVAPTGKRRVRRGYTKTHHPHSAVDSADDLLKLLSIGPRNVSEIARALKRSTVSVRAMVEVLRQKGHKVTETRKPSRQGPFMKSEFSLG